MKLIKKNGEILELTVQEYKELYNIPSDIYTSIQPIFTDPPKWNQSFWGDDHVTAVWN